MRRNFLIGLVLVAVGATTGTSDNGLTRQQQLSKLLLEERQFQLQQRTAALQTAQSELESTRDLFDRGFVPLLTYNQTKNSYEDARLQLEESQILLEETKLDLLKNATRIVLRDARKYRSDDGKSMVDIVLENASDVQEALIVDPTLNQGQLLGLLKVENIFVSLVSGAIVGEPYEMRIPSLDVGERQTLTFRLLRDEAAVAIELSYLDIVGESLPVILRKGGDQELPSINSAQFSQTGELQQNVRFDLTLERLSDEERSFALAVVGLPKRIETSFVDDGAKVNQVKFDENKARDTLALQLEIPEKLDRRFIGRTRTFFALVTETS
ncbi:MAG TPA: hypothetical protein QF604_21890, partial [Candidatus Latescibacteria bacterium]|nr:hypothetical protein [Candidatus Latescibacterota bacterium]